MSPLLFDRYGSPVYVEYDIVNFGRTGFIKVSAELDHNNSTRGSRLIESLSRPSSQATDGNGIEHFACEDSGLCQIFKLMVSTSEKIPNNINVVAWRQVK